jgi:hypothetical protein
MFALARVDVFAEVGQGTRPKLCSIDWQKRFEAISVPRSDHAQ